MKYHHKILTDQIDNIPVIAIEGDMTSDADADVKKIYSDFKEKQNYDRIIINFDKTKYINSSGIATLISIIQDISEKKGSIYFVGMSDHLKKVMDIVGISDFVKIYSTNEEASRSQSK